MHSRTHARARTHTHMLMQASCDRWLSIYGMSDQAAAFAIDALQVHILIDLNGHSKGARLGVLLRRPAPIIIRSSPSSVCVCLSPS